MTYVTTKVQRGTGSAGTKEWLQASRKFSFVNFSRDSNTRSFPETHEKMPRDSRTKK